MPSHTPPENQENNATATSKVSRTIPVKRYVLRWLTLTLLSITILALLMLQGCGITTTATPPLPPGTVDPNAPEGALTLPFDYSTPNPLAQTIQMPTSRWVPAAWSELPGWNEDQIGEVWQAWLQSCSQPSASWVMECGQIIHLASASESTKRQWMYNHLQPYRVESLEGNAAGMLTAYYEPIFRAHRSPTGDFKYPLYRPPANLHPTKPYWTRQEIESNPRAQRAVKDYSFAYLADPLDVLILHIQGSGQLILTEPDGQTHIVRAAFAASNNHRYGSVGRYLLNRKLITDATWPGIKTWLDQNPKRLNEVLWSNPRYIFFNEVALEDPTLGPAGAQGVPLTYGRSIAVDKTSIPYGTPVWIASVDPTKMTSPIQKLVVAQDTGSAIIGAVRADYFWGKGPEAGEQAGRTKQTLYMWTFLPRKN